MVLKCEVPLEDFDFPIVPTHVLLSTKDACMAAGNSRMLILNEAAYMYFLLKFGSSIEHKIVP